MRIYRRLPIMQSDIAARCRNLWLIAASTLASAFLGVSEPALAQNFTPVPLGQDLTAAQPTTMGSGTFDTNINFGGPTTPPPFPPGLTVTLQPSVQQPGVVQVTIPAGSLPDAVNLANTTGSIATPGVDANLTVNSAIINNIANPSAGTPSGLRIQASGNATITATNTQIAVTGAGNANGIWSIVLPSSDPTTATKVGYTGPGITVTGGANSTGIQAENRGNGNASVDARGNITVIDANDPKFFRFGLLAKSVGGDASVHYGSGMINVSGSVANGIQASSQGDGSATVITDKGTTINVSSNAAVAGSVAGSGVIVFLSKATAANGRAATATVASTITSIGPANLDPNSFPLGIFAQSSADAPIFVNYTGPGITTKGGNGSGITALSAGGTITINSFGPINTTDGSNAIGISADSGFFLTGPQPATVTVNATDVLTMGQFGTAISATAGGNVAVNIASGASVMGGWQADLTSVGSFSLLPAAGVILGSSGSTATLTNNGSIGALSDRAVASSPFFPSNNTSIINNGTITGFVELVGGNNSFVNNGTFNLRHFADTTGAVDASGNGVRDTVRVAIADLGPGDFTNNGTLTLPAVTGATTLDNTGQYLPGLGNALLPNPNNKMALNGPLQGQMIGVTTFINSGTIDLQANPVAGDVLMITGGRGGATPGTGGGGTFISNGGKLLLDTVLNEGGAATRSDTLVVDGTRVDSGGATSMAIRNAGGTGALTEGDGILVVQVLDPARSVPGVFKLAGEVSAGAFDYDLFLGGIGGSRPGDWFLRDTFVVPKPPGPGPGPGPQPQPEPPPFLPPGDTGLPEDPPPNPLPPGVFPIIGPRIATYGVVQPLARQLGLAILGTLNDRVGDTYEPEPAPAPTPTIPSGISKEGGKEVVAPPPPVAAAPCPWFAPSVWTRFFAQSIDNHYRAFADPRTSGYLWGFQGGVDLLRGSLFAGHYERAGLYGAYGRVNTDVDGLVTNPADTAYSLSRTGSIKLDAVSVGGYWTHVGPCGWYLDGVLQGTWYWGSASTQFSRLSTDGTGFIASLEGGWPLCWPQSWPQLGPGFVIEPQGQILWQEVSFHDKNDGVGSVALGDTTGPSGRIGVRTKWTIATAGGQVWQPYLRANLWRDWNADATTVFGRGGAPLASEATIVELGGGLTVRINANVSVYANVDYEFAVDDTDGDRRDGVRGAFGARYTW